MTALLPLVQWFSPAFPTGAYAYSGGLEWAIAQGDVRGAHDLAGWIRAVIAQGSGWQDAVLVSLAMRPGADLAALSDLAIALQPSAERVVETVEQGRAFAACVSAVTGWDLPARPLPVAAGEAAARLGAAVEDAVTFYLMALAGNLVTIGVRFVPLGQSDGQRVLAGLHGIIADIALRATRADTDDLGTAALGADFASLRHETMETRIFRT